MVSRRRSQQMVSTAAGSIDGLMKLFDKDDKDGDGKPASTSSPAEPAPGKRPNNRGVPVESDGMVLPQCNRRRRCYVLDGVKVKVEAQGPGGEAVKLPGPITIKQDVEKPEKEARTEL